MDRIVEKWIERAEYDMETARAMLYAKRYLYVAYICQQSIEKALKALIAYKNIANLPIHNLNRLAEIAGIQDELSPFQFEFFAELTPYCIEARYGDYKESLNEIINKDKAEMLLEETERIFQWIIQKIN